MGIAKGCVLLGLIITRAGKTHYVGKGPATPGSLTRLAPQPVGVLREREVTAAFDLRAVTRYNALHTTPSSHLEV